MAKSNIIKGTTKSGISYSIDSRITNDAKVARKLAKCNDPAVKADPMKSVSACFDFLEAIFGSEGLDTFMDEIAARNGGICETEKLMAEAKEVLNAVTPKN